MERLEEHRWVYVALMVGAEDHGTRGRYVLAAYDLVTDTGQVQRQPDGAVAEHEQHLSNT